MARVSFSTGLACGLWITTALVGCANPLPVAKTAEVAGIPATAPIALNSPAEASVVVDPTKPAVAADTPATTGRADRGQELYETRCIACHSLDENRVGPMHNGVFGRKAGSVPDFDYSPAVKAAKIVWGEKTLDAWLTNPEALIPGQKMGYSVPDPADRADIIAYLKTATGK